MWLLLTLYWFDGNIMRWINCAKWLKGLNVIIVLEFVIIVWLVRTFINFSSYRYRWFVIFCIFIWYIDYILINTKILFYIFIFSWTYFNLAYQVLIRYLSTDLSNNIFFILFLPWYCSHYYLWYFTKILFIINIILFWIH